MAYQVETFETNNPKQVKYLYNSDTKIFTVRYAMKIEYNRDSWFHDFT